MKKRFLAVVFMAMIFILSGCSKGKDEENIVLKMPGLESQKYTEAKFTEYLKENEESILDYLDNINRNFAFKDNELYLDNKKVSSVTVDVEGAKDLDKAFFYSNLKADNDSDLVINILIDEKDGMNSKITEKTVGVLKEERDKFNKEYVEAGMTEKEGKLYFNNKPVNSIIEDDSSGKSSIFYPHSDGVQVKVTRDSSGKITNIEEVK